MQAAELAEIPLQMHLDFTQEQLVESKGRLVDLKKIRDQKLK